MSSIFLKLIIAKTSTLRNKSWLPTIIFYDTQAMVVVYTFLTTVGYDFNKIFCLRYRLLPFKHLLWSKTVFLL